MEDELAIECCICAEEFTICGENIPLLLPCAHTFCKACLSFALKTNNNNNNNNIHPGSFGFRHHNFTQNTFMCAVCKQPTNLSPNQQDFGLQVNQGVVSSLKERGEPKVEMCGCGKNQASVFCYNCEVDFCNDCFAQAHTLPGMKQHLTTETAAKLSTVCSVHNNSNSNSNNENNNLNAFCNDCSKPVCFLCCIGPCKQHHVELLTKAEISKRLQGAVGQLRNCLQRIEETKAAVQLAVKNDAAAHERTTLQVQKSFAQLRNTLDEQEKSILEKLNQAHNSTVKTLLMHLDHASMVSDCIRFVSLGCDQALANAQNPQIRGAEILLSGASVLAQSQNIIPQSSRLCAVQLHTLCASAQSLHSVTAKLDEIVRNASNTCVQLKEEFVRSNPLIFVANEVRPQRVVKKTTARRTQAPTSQSPLSQPAPAPQLQLQQPFQFQFPQPAQPPQQFNFQPAPPKFDFGQPKNT